MLSFVSFLAALHFSPGGRLPENQKGEGDCPQLPRNGR